MRRTLVVITLVVAAGLAVAHAQRSPAGLTSTHWTVDGVERTALVAIPDGAPPPDGWPLALVFHGHGGSSAQAARSFRIHEHWSNAVVVYPQGLPTPGQISDPAGRRAGWQSAPGAQNDRDLNLVDHILTAPGGSLRIDRSRVFAAGHSNGGSMVYVLWRVRSSEFAAFAPSSSVFLRNLPGAEPKPAFVVAGKKDLLVPFRAQERSLDAMLSLNRADQTGTAWGDGQTMHRSPEGAHVVAYIHDGGHRLPDDAGRWMVEFFRSVTPAAPPTGARGRP